MILRPLLKDYKIIFYYCGKVLLGLAPSLLIPISVALIFKEYDMVFNFLIGLASFLLAGYLLMNFFLTKESAEKYHGLIIVGVSWLIATCLAAIPYRLSGFFKSYLDACFDVMSGFTTTGLILIQNLDHAPYSLNMWRSLLTFMGGQGIIVIALTFLIPGSIGGLTMYTAEGRAEKLEPNIVTTARIIWKVSILYLVIGSLTIWLICFLQGMPKVDAFFHSIWLFMGAWSTGGFAPQSQNILYYHSLAIELVTMIIFVLGSFNFALHYAILSGNRREIYRNIELISFFITGMLTFTIVLVGLMQLSVYPNFMALIRKGLYQILSGHTTTGYMTIYANQFYLEWGYLSMAMVICAMTIGASSCSTGGGIKNIRVGIIFKALVLEIKKLLLPRTAVVDEKFHHLKDIILTDELIKSTYLITLSYIFLYLVGALVGMFYNYDFIHSLFESVSAASNTGLSCGIIQPAIPSLLKVIYILQMWCGRLEFVAVFAIIGFIMTIIKGK